MKNRFKTIKTGVVLMVFLFTTLYALPQKVWGGYPVVEVGANLVVNEASSFSLGLIAGEEFAQTSKELIGDTLVSVAKEILIQMVTDSIVRWIKSGYKGDPMFVTDFEGFMLDVANEVTGHFISEMGLTDLCSFKPYLLIQLSTNSPYRQRAECTLGDVVENFEAFHEDFNEGGWGAFITLAEPQNNYFGASYMAQEEREKRVRTTLEVKGTKLNWAKGVLEWEDCDGGGYDPATEEYYPDTCITKTPGSVIYKQLNDILPSGLKNLELADEINEIVGAALVQGLKQVMGSGNGLIGSNSTAYRAPEGISDNAKEVLNKSIATVNDYINTEKAYRAIKQDSLNAVNNAESVFRLAATCFEEKSKIQLKPGEKLVVRPNKIYLQEELLRDESALMNEVADEKFPSYNDSDFGFLTIQIEALDKKIAKMEAYIIKVTDVLNRDSSEELFAMMDDFNEVEKLKKHNQNDFRIAKEERDGDPGLVGINNSENDTISRSYYADIARGQKVTIEGEDEISGILNKMEYLKGEGSSILNTCKAIKAVDGYSYEMSFHNN